MPDIEEAPLTVPEPRLARIAAGRQNPKRNSQGEGALAEGVARPLDRWGNVEHRRLGGDTVRDILLRHGAAAARFTVEAGERLSPHGLRAGFVTEAHLAGARDEQVMEHIRHRDPKTMRGDVRRARLVADSATKLRDL
jgi:integrase